MALNERSRQFLHDMLTTPSPSGFEQRVGRLWRDYVDDVADATEVDVMGNWYAEVRGKGGPRIMLTAHLDEVGLMITRVGEDGLLRFREIGGVHVETLPGQPVEILTNHGDDDATLPGVVGWNGYARTTSGPPTMSELHIDIGADHGPEARELVKPGDPVVFQSYPRYLGADKFVARGIDNRMGAFMSAEVLRDYAEEPGSATVLAAMTTMEETGSFGAKTVAHDRDLDAALCVDITYDTILPGVDPDVYGAHGIGMGPVITVGGAVSPVLRRLLRAAAEDIEVPIQYEVCPNRTLTDADYFQVNQRGLPHIGIMVAARNVHTAHEVISMRDVEQSIELMTAFLKGLPADLDLRRN